MAVIILWCTCKVSASLFKQHTHTLSCQPTAWPFWVGFAGSFAVVTVVNWVLFAMVSLCACFSNNQEKSRVSPHLSHLLVAVVLSILFTVAWTFFLISVADPLENVNVASQYIYAVFFAVHSIFLLVLHAVRSPETRMEWIRIWHTLTCNKDTYHVRQTENSPPKEVYLSNKSTLSQELEGGMVLKEVSSVEATEFVKTPDTSLALENFTATHEMTEKEDLEKKQIDFPEELNSSTHL